MYGKKVVETNTVSLRDSERGISLLQEFDITCREFMFSMVGEAVVEY